MVVAAPAAPAHPRGNHQQPPRWRRPEQEKHSQRRDDRGTGPKVGMAGYLWPAIVATIG